MLHIEEWEHMGSRVAGKVAIVTGAAQGIGYGIAAMLAAEGARVVVGDIQSERGEAAAAEIRAAGGEARFHYADLIDEAQCEGLVAAAVTAYGRLDILVNNAGIYPRATLEETTTELWDKVVNVTLRSAFYCCKYAVPAMREAGGGSIINIGSINGIQGLANLVAYASAKGGLLTLTRTLAGACASDGIRVNYIIPGWVLTEGEIALHRDRGTDEATLRQAGRRLRLGRHQTPEDTAYMVVYLASDESAQVTGTVMHVDAGMSELPIPVSDPYAG
jgi:NAD(P)-dependent dehydrogenase (short-subunit alcohol dehydrogenase family)